MAEYKTPTNTSEYHSNFAQIHPLMNPTEAYYESSRCLFCYDAPCVHACPTGIDIPLFIRQINTGDALTAAKTIYDANYFGNACGKVCPTEVLCEGACVFNLQDVPPIDIGRLQTFATTKAIEVGAELFEIEDKNNIQVAVVGAGPAGISCACELSRLGYSVTVFEGRAKPSGLTIHGVAPYKITDEDALAEVAYLQRQFGFEIQYNSWIDATRLSGLGRDYAAVFVGVGLGATSTVSIPGIDMDGCFGAVEFIEELRSRKSDMTIGKRVVVIGGGNTAMDAASEAARFGAESVTLAYRRSKDSMRAYDFEYDLAKQAGVDGLFNVQPIQVSGEGSVERILFARMQVVDGVLTVVDGVGLSIDCDMVICATGQSKQKELLISVNGLELDAQGKIVVNTFGQTANPRYFAGGDAVNGGKEVVNAVAEGTNAARGIDTYISGQGA